MTISKIGIAIKESLLYLTTKGLVNRATGSMKNFN